LRLIT